MIVIQRLGMGGGFICSPCEFNIPVGQTRPITFMFKEGRRKLDLTNYTITISLIDDTIHHGESFWPHHSDDESTMEDVDEEVDDASCTLSNQTTNKGEFTWTPVAANTLHPGRYVVRFKVVVSAATEYWPDDLNASPPGKLLAYVTPMV